MQTSRLKTTQTTVSVLDSFETYFRALKKHFKNVSVNTSAEQSTEKKSLGWIKQQ